MRILSTSEPDLRLAASALASGKLVALPTETVYGLGANAYDPEALARVFEAKRRPTFDPLIVHIADLATLDKIADFSLLAPVAAGLAHALAASLWPGPLTLILPKKAIIPDLATSGLPTVAVRFPAHPVALRLIALSTGAVAAPSANPFGYISPTDARHVADTLGDRIDFIVDGGPCEVGVESTVLDLTSQGPTILRPGGMPRERIEAVIGPVSVLVSKSFSAIGPDVTNGQEPQAGPASVSPGLLASHYAPRAPLELFPYGHLPRERAADPGLALLFFDARSRNVFFQELDGGSGNVRFGAGNAGFESGNAGVEAPVGSEAFASVGRQSQRPIIRVLSQEGNPVEAAASLFKILHELDGLKVTGILAERVPAGGLGDAINDRLFKARAAAR